MSEKAVQELEKKKKRIIASVKHDPIVQQVETLLLEAHSEEEELLETIGLNHYGNYQKELTSKLGRTAKMEEIYNRPVFTGQMVKELCQTYSLKALPAKYFIGELAVEVPGKISEFCKENDITAKSNNFYILAPDEMFNTEKQELPPREPKNVDPILFYIDKGRESTSNNTVEETDELIQVANWGKDFTEARKFRHLLSGYVNNDNDISMKSSTLIAIGLAIMAFIIGVGFNISYFGLGLILISMIIMIKNSIGIKKIDRAWNEPKH